MITMHRFPVRFWPVTWGCLFLSVGAFLASWVGVTAREATSLVTTVTVRGESVEWVATGPYAFNAVRTVAEGIGWDWVTLVLAAPSLAVASFFAARGALRGRLVASGLVAYLFYQYLLYATTWALGPLFPVFILLFSGSLWTLVGLLKGLAPELQIRPWPAGFPRRSLAMLCLGLATVLVLMWTIRIATGLTGSIQGLLLGQTTLVVQALDLGLVVPLAVVVAVLTLRRHPAALLWGPVLLGKAVFMTLAIAAMLLTAWSVEGTLEVVPLVIFGSAALASTVLGWKVLRVL